MQVRELSGANVVSKISLSHRWLGPLDGMVIGTLVAQNSSLVELDLSNNMLGQRRDVAVVAISDALRANPPALRSINLAKNYISTDGARALGRALPHNFALRVLNLANNEIDGPSAVELCDGVMHNKGLSSLILSANEIDDASVAQVGAALQRGPVLRTIDMSGQHKSQA